MSDGAEHPGLEQAGSGRDITVAVLASTAGERPDAVVMSLASKSTIWSYGESGSRFVPSKQSVIVGSEVFTPSVSRVLVHHLEPAAGPSRVIESAFDNQPITGTRTYAGHVFFSTHDGIYILDDQRLACRKIARVDAVLGFRGFSVLSYDDSECTIAVIGLWIPEVFVLTFAKGRTTATRCVKWPTPSLGMVPVGGHNGLIYYSSGRLSGGRSCHYAAFRDGVEVKRRRLDNCDTLLDMRICDGLLTCVYLSDDSARTQYVCGIDLDADTVVFKTSLDELGLLEIYFVIPMLAESSNLNKI